MTRSTLLRAAGLLAALFVLNAALSFHNVWPTPGVTLRREVSVEIALLVLALAAFGRRTAGSRAAASWIAAALLLWTLARYAEVTAPALYGRGINLYWDSRHAGAVLGMLARVVPAWQLLLGAAGAATLLVGLWWLLRACTLQLATALHPVPSAAAIPRGARRTLAGAACLLVLLFSADRALDWRVPGLYFSTPVTQTWSRQVALVAGSLRGGGESGVGAAPLPASSLGAAAGADVFVVFVESYGAVAFEQPAIQSRLAASRARLERAASGSGRQVVSAYVTSTTFGGNSWLAHASLLSGVPVRDPDDYARLLVQKRESLTDRFRAGGYRILALMPGLRQEWPEGQFYRFDTITDAARLEYRGPEFGWWRIPDQFALARFDQLEDALPEESGSLPRFVFVTTISSHMPFRPTPPYQPDWDRVTGGEPYDATVLRAALAQAPEWADLRPAYAESIAYAQDSLAGYLQRHSGRPLVMVVLGDHQPPAVVSGEGASWNVPVHIITDRPAILTDLRANGFVDGIHPAGRSSGSLHELGAVLLRALDTSVDAAR